MDHELIGLRALGALPGELDAPRLDVFGVQRPDRDVSARRDLLVVPAARQLDEAREGRALLLADLHGVEQRNDHPLALRVPHQVGAQLPLKRLAVPRRAGRVVVVVDDRVLVDLRLPARRAAVVEVDELALRRVVELGDACRLLVCPEPEEHRVGALLLGVQIEGAGLGARRRADLAGRLLVRRLVVHGELVGAAPQQVHRLRREPPHLLAGAVPLKRVEPPERRHGAAARAVVEIFGPVLERRELKRERPRGDVRHHQRVNALRVGAVAFVLTLVSLGLVLLDRGELGLDEALVARVVRVEGVAPVVAVEQLLLDREDDRLPILDGLLGHLAPDDAGQPPELARLVVVPDALRRPRELLVVLHARLVVLLDRAGRDRGAVVVPELARRAADLLQLVVELVRGAVGPAAELLERRDIAEAPLPRRVQLLALQLRGVVVTVARLERQALVVLDHVARAALDGAVHDLLVFKFDALLPGLKEVVAGHLLRASGGREREEGGEQEDGQVTHRVLRGSSVAPILPTLRGTLHLPLRPRTAASGAAPHEPNLPGTTSPNKAPGVRALGVERGSVSLCATTPHQETPNRACPTPRRPPGRQAHPRWPA